MAITSEHLFWNYRLGKFEVAASRALGRLPIAKFENNLSRNLRQLATHIGKSEKLFDGLDPGGVWLRPKSIERPSRSETHSSYVTVPEKAHDHQILGINVRILLEPTPEFTTCEVIWLREFGAVLDATLEPNCLGSRLELHGAPPQIPISGRRVYKYWAPAYKKFRSTGIEMAKWLLSHNDRRCVLSTFDLTSYYDNIDPSFLTAPDFCETLQANATATGLDFDLERYFRATTGLLDAFERFRLKVQLEVGIKRAIGIPIGSLTSRIIANLALSELDRHVMAKPTVEYYARYVDDILVVEKPTPHDEIASHHTVPRLMPLDTTRSTSDIHILDNAQLKRLGSDFRIQARKLRVFDLNGKSGLEYLSAVESEIQRISSERRRFLEPWKEESDHTIMASSGSEPIRVLREADALSLRRLAVGAVSDKVETSAVMLDRSEASRYSRTYLGKIGKLATDWSQWVDFIDVSLRVLGSALLSGDQNTANEIVAALFARLASLHRLKDTYVMRWGSDPLPDRRASDMLRDWFEAQIAETFCRATPFTNTSFVISGLHAVERGFRLRGRRLSPSTLLYRAKLLAAADLRLVDRESDLAMGTPRSTSPTRGMTDLHLELLTDEEYQIKSPNILDYLNACQELSDPAYSTMLPVELLLLCRPPTYVDILYRWLRAERHVNTLLGVINAVRGHATNRSQLSKLTRRFSPFPPEMSPQIRMTQETPELSSATSVQMTVGGSNH